MDFITLTNFSSTLDTGIYIFGGFNIPYDMSTLIIALKCKQVVFARERENYNSYLATTAMVQLQKHAPLCRLMCK